jgi:hypothetical protein
MKIIFSVENMILAGLRIRPLLCALSSTTPSAMGGGGLSDYVDYLFAMFAVRHMCFPLIFTGSNCTVYIYSRRGGIGALSLKITYLYLAITFLKEKILRHRFFLCEGEGGGFLLRKDQLITVNSHSTTPLQR